MNPFYRDETAVSSLQISSSTEQVTSTTVDVKFLVVSNLFDMPEKEDEQSLQYLHHVIGCKGAKELGSGAFATCYGGKIGKGHIFNVNPEQELAIKFYNKVEIDSRYVLEAKNDSFKSDVESINNIRHENIMKFYGCFQIYEDTLAEKCSSSVVVHDQQPTESHFKLRGSGLILEKMDATLFDVKYDFDRPKETFSHDVVKKLFLHIGSALNYIHKEYYRCHKDLSWCNIGLYLGPDGLPSQFKLIDFGNSIAYTKNVFESYLGRTAEVIQNPFCIEVYEFAEIVMNLVTRSSFNSTNVVNEFINSDSLHGTALRQILIALASKEDRWTLIEAVEFLSM